MGISGLSDVQRRRKEKKWSRAELLKRVLWNSFSPFFRYSPRLCWGFRRQMLRLFGAQVGKHANIYSSVRIMIPWNLEIGDWVTIGNGVLLYALGKISIGSDTTVSQGAHLCAGTHDYQSSRFTLIKSEISIGSKAWICADAFIGPDVVIQEGAVVAARAVVNKDASAWTVVGGNPAKEIKHRTMAD
jgi:putative colanic acid biosynthesis acetyltransferase WcaF